MPRRHVRAHFAQVRAKHVFLVSYAEHRIEGRDNRTLGTGFSTELLRTSAVRFNSLVYDAVRYIRMVLPAVNVRANAVVIDERLTMLRHSAESRVHRTHRGFNLGEKSFQLLRVARFRGIQTIVQYGHRGSSLPLNLHVNQNEPLLVDAPEKILDQPEITAFDLARRIEAEKIVKSITAIAENRGTAQTLCNLIPGHSKPRWQDQFGPRSSPDVSMPEIA